MTEKKTFWRNVLLPCLVAGLLCLGFAAQAQDQKPVPVRVGVHKDYTRLVFDYTRLTAYRADKKGDGIALAFDNPAPLSLPADKENMTMSSTHDNGVTRLDIGLPPGSTFKHYRLDRKIVIDVYPGKGKIAAAKPAPKKAEPPPVKKEVKKDPPVAAAPKKEPPKEPVKTAEAPPAEPKVEDLRKAIESKMPAVPVPPVIVDEAPPPAIAKQEAAPAPRAPTVITISTIAPTRLAVFKRFGVLWIVMDTEAAGALEPSATGPEAGLLGNPKIVKFKNGTAYRYTLPPARFVSVEKENLTWRVTLSADDRQPPARNLINVVRDGDAQSGKVRLMAEIKGSSSVMEVQDPAIGDTLYVVATAEQEQRIDQGRHFPDLEIIPASIGMVVRPAADDIRANRIENFVLVTAPGGIKATPGATAGPAAVSVARRRPGEEARLFDFPNWRQGGPQKLYHNARAMLNDAAAADEGEARTATLMRLALLYFANNFGQETLGVLRMIETDTPDMAKNPNFIALRGAAEAMAGNYAEALKDLSHPAIQQHAEVNLWIGYAAAATEQWRMANRAFPADNYLLLQYPDSIAVPFTVYMAESRLRLGQMESAEKLLSTLDTMKGGFGAHYQAAIQYLKGEAARQSGRPEEAVRIWRPVAFGLDRLYHTKASLALANLRLQEKMIDIKEAIDTVDSLRFAWRGDGLEVQILHNLGQLKIKNKQYLSGLEDMQTAIKLADSLLDDSQPIKDDMADVFTDLFVKGGLKGVSPLEAVSIYNGFSSYMPAGEEGAAATLSFAESLISIDLLGKAAELLKEQLDAGLVPATKRPAIQNKLAAVYLLDRLPQRTLATLDEAGDNNVAGELADERRLLRARAMSQLNRTKDAIAALDGLETRDALKLKADVLWRAKKWTEAAAVIEKLLPAAGSGIDEAEAQLVVNAAVAYKLAGDADGLMRTKARYGSAMEATSLGNTFGTVTRSEGRSSLADRETLLNIINEVDMFKGFLDTYKARASKGS